MNRIHITAIIVVAAAVWAVGLVVSGIQLTADFAKPFSLSTGAVVLAFAAFDQKLWQLRLLKGWFVQRPVLRGTWEIRLKPHRIDAPTARDDVAIQAYLIVRQSYSAISMRLLTSESSSQMFGAELIRLSDGVFQVVGVYVNEPRVSVRERSPIHYGAVILHVRGDPPQSLDGSYWTDRLTVGEIQSGSHTRRICHSFGEARAELGDAEHSASAPN